MQHCSLLSKPSRCELPRMLYLTSLLRIIFCSERRCFYDIAPPSPPRGCRPPRLQLLWPFSFLVLLSGSVPVFTFTFPVVTPCYCARPQHGTLSIKTSSQVAHSRLERCGLSGLFQWSATLVSTVLPS
jgi:hypothetical protein